MAHEPERREHPRIETTDRCWVESGNRVLYLSIADLSAGGAFVRTAVPLEVGSRAVLKWSIMGNHEVVANAQVVRVSSAPQYGMGLRLLEVREGREVLADYIELERRRSEPGL